MEIIMIGFIAIAFGVGVVMAAALVSDFRAPANRMRAWVVATGAVAMAAAPIIAEAPQHWTVIGSLFTFMVNFGIAASVMYIVVLVASGLATLFKPKGER